jgi:hypothetical protein
MSLDKLNQAFRRGLVVPAASPDVHLRLDTSELVSPDGVHVLLGEVILLLQSLYGQVMTMVQAGISVVPVVPVSQLMLVVTAVAVAIEEERAPTSPPSQLGIEGVEPGIEGGDGGGAETPPVDASSADYAKALCVARDVLKRYHRGELRTYGAVEGGIALSPLPDVTRFYVASARPGWTPVTTCEGVIDWEGLKGINTPLPEEHQAGVDARIASFNSDGGSVKFEVCHCHKSSRQFERLFEANAQGHRPHNDARLATEAVKEVLGMAATKQWLVRMALNVSRPLLKPTKASFVVTQAFLVGQSREVFHKEVDALIKAATSRPQQLALWDAD